MTVTRVGEATFAQDVHDAVVGLGEGDTTVLDVRVESYVDVVTELEAWRVTLYLPRPHGRTWNIDRLVELEREAQDRTDDVALRRRLELEGTTTVTVTTNDPRPWRA